MSSCCATLCTQPTRSSVTFTLLAGTSLENNNVFTVQPTVYFEGMDPATESASMYQDVDLMPSGPLNPATVTVGIVALGIVAVAGSATAIYYEVRVGTFSSACALTGCLVCMQQIHTSKGFA
jgi:hypothetical protein